MPIGMGNLVDLAAKQAAALKPQHRSRPARLREACATIRLVDERALRTVLLIRSIDEGDKAFEVLSEAERSDATRAAAEGAGEITQGLAGPSLPPAAERMLVRRAELLLTKLKTRAPVIPRVLELSSGVYWLGSALMLAAWAFGVSLSALDGRKHIDILAFPLFGLVAWNLLVYLLTLFTWLQPKGAHGGRFERVSGWYARWMHGRATALLRHSSHFNVPLAEALQRFASEWSTIARPLLLLRAQRLFHLGAALLALGLVTGLYVRGLVFRYDAGWQSTFLGASQVHRVIGVVYGPASALSGIDLPSVGELESLQWREVGTGASAAPFIHLIALTSLLYIILPRLLLAIATSSALSRQSRHPPLPAAFLPYARSILRETGRVSGLTAGVVSYAYTPAQDALAGLQALLADALGTDLNVQLRRSVAYGDEDSFAQQLTAAPLPPADCQVLLMNAAAMPESENHGAMIEAMQRGTSKQSGYLLVIDESAYVARMQADASLAPRIAERARNWRAFGAARNQPTAVVDLGRLRTGAEPDPSVVSDIQEALRRPVSA